MLHLSNLMRRYSGSPAGRSTGLAVVELALVLPLLLIFLFGMIDFGRALIARNELTNLSREAANLGSRGTRLNRVVEALLESSPALADHGFLIMSEIERDPDGSLIISDRAVGGPSNRGSKVGGLGGTPNLPHNQLPQAGQILIVSEVFLDFNFITPIDAFLSDNSPLRNLYDAAYFY